MPGHHVTFLCADAAQQTAFPTPTTAPEGRSSPHSPGSRYWDVLLLLDYSFPATRAF